MRVLSTAHTSIYIADGILDKTQGVIGREYILENGVLLIPNCNWVHTFFLTKPLWVYFFPQDFSEVIAAQQLSPNKLSKWMFSASHVIESWQEHSDGELMNFSEVFLKTNRA